MRRIATLIVVLGLLIQPSALAQHFDGNGSNGIFEPQLTVSASQPGSAQLFINRPTTYSLDVTQADHEDPAVISQLRQPEWQFAFETTKPGQTPSGTPATKCSQTIDNHGNSPDGTGTGTNTDYSKRTDAVMVRAEKVGTIRLQAAADGISRPGPPILWTGDVGFTYYDAVNHVGHMCALLITTDTRVTHIPDPTVGESSPRDEIEDVTEIVLDFTIALVKDSSGTYQETLSDLGSLAKDSTFQTLNVSLIELGATLNGHSAGNWHAGGIDFSKAPAVSGGKNAVGIFTTCPPADPAYKKCVSDKTPVTRKIPFTFTIPTPSLSGPASGSLLNVNPVPVTGTSDPGATVQIYEGGLPVSGATAVADGAGHWTANTPLADGSHTVVAKVVDANGASKESNNTSFVLDTTPPAPPTIVQPAEGVSTDGTTVTFSGSTEPGAVVDVFRAGAQIASTHASNSGAWNTQASLLKGPNSVSVRATDVAGNIGAFGASRSFSVTTATPVIVTPEQNDAKNKQSISIQGVAEPSSVVSISDNTTSLGSSVADTSGAWSFQATLPEGTHKLTAVAMHDGFTSSVSTTRLLVIDLTPPAAAVITSPANGVELKSGNVSIAGTSEPDASIVIFEGARRIGESTAGANGEWTVAASLWDGDHTVVAQVADRAGNVGPDSSPLFFKVKDPLELVSPAADSMHSGSVTIGGHADTRSSRVTLFEGGAEIGHADVANGEWSVTLAFVSGLHSVSAQATTNGTLGRASLPVGFRVDADAPGVVLFRPSGDTGAAGIIINEKVHGTAAEPAASDSGLASVMLTYTNLLTGFSVERRPDSCLRCTNSTYAVWNDRPNLFPGLYAVTATATDRVGNVAKDSATFLLTN